MSGYGSMSGEGREGMDRMKDDLSQKTDEVMDQAREQTGQAVEKVRGSAFQMMDQQKHRAADGLGSVAQALRQTGDSLRGGEQGALGQYADKAADTIEQMSQQLHDKSVDQLLSEAEQFARREPEVFLGGAVLLGLLASRFLKASGRRSQMRDQGYGDYGYQYGRTYSQGNYRQAGYGRVGPGGYDRGTSSGEGIDYRSAGTGGYRTTIAGETSRDAYSTGGSMTAGELSGGRSTSRRRGSEIEDTESHLNDESWHADEDEMPGGGAGSSQA